MRQLRGSPPVKAGFPKTPASPPNQSARLLQLFKPLQPAHLQSISVRGGSLPAAVQPTERSVGQGLRYPRVFEASPRHSPTADPLARDTVDWQGLPMPNQSYSRAISIHASPRFGQLDTSNRVFVMKIIRKSVGRSVISEPGKRAAVKGNPTG